MIDVYAGFRIKAPAEEVWSVISWEGVEKLQGQGTFYKRVRFDSRKPVAGATRTFYPEEEGPGFIEVLLSYDETMRRYTYGVLDGGHLPFGNYTGQVCATAAGPEACTLCFSGRGVPVGITPAEFQAFYTEAETGIANAIRSVLGCG